MATFERYFRKILLTDGLNQEAVALIAITPPVEKVNIKLSKYCFAVPNWVSLRQFFLFKYIYIFF